MINVIGYISGGLGLGTAARATIRSLVDAGIPVATVDIELADKRSYTDSRWSHLNVQPAELSYPINLWHMNPLDARAIRERFPEMEQGRFNAIVPFWELSRPPLDWLAAFASYEMVLAPSRFIEGVISSDTSTNVRYYPIGMEPVQSSIQGDTRVRFGIPGDVFCFYTAFDLNSSIHRKNPMGAVRAFSLAFGTRKDVALVIKINGALADPRARDLRELLARTKNAVVIETYLSYDDNIAVIAACDAYVSLHRAEGFGYGPFEAMTLGKPVVATGWSGNMDYMDETNSLPVQYVLTPVSTLLRDYAQTRFDHTAYWAEPDIHHAATLMIRVVSDATFAANIGQRAQARAAQRNTDFLAGKSIEVLLSAYGANQFARATGTYSG